MMKNFRKIENNLDTIKIKEIKDIKTLLISSSIIKNENPFKILVNKGNEIKIGDVLMENEDGQKILSSVSGKVVNVSLKEEYKDVLTYYIEIENDFKNNKVEKKIKPIKTKEDLINAVKLNGIISKDFLIYKYFKNIEKSLKISCFDEPFVFNNNVVLINYFNKIEKAIKKLKDILKFEKVEIYTNKVNLEFARKLKTSKDKLYKKKPKQNALNMFDLYKIYNLLNKKNINEELFSITGKALKESSVILSSLGVKFADIIDKFGGFRQDIESIENFKYTAMLAYNDEVLLKDKIKNCKDEKDKEKLKRMLENKQKEAEENIYSKLNEYHDKYVNCLSACFITVNNKKIATKSFELALQNSFYGLHLLNYKQFH